MNDTSTFDDQESIEQHESAIMRAFVAVIRAEQRISVAKTDLSNATARCKTETALASAEMDKAWQTIQSLMAETGEPEVILPGAANDYRIAWSTPRESVKVESVDAVPEEYVKVERTPKLKEIGDYLRGLRKARQTLPNWANLEKGSPKLMWESIKKRAI